MAQQFHPLDSPARSALANLSRLPLSFIPNAGQTNPAARFLVKSLGGTLFFTPTGVVLLLPNPKNVLNPDAPGGRETRLDRLPASAVWIQYLDSNLSAQLTGADPLPGEVNYLMGNNPKKWMTHLPTYAGVDYHELYAGIDLRYEGREGHLKSVYRVAPGADPAAIRWQYKGATGISIDDAGSLVIALPASGNPTGSTTLLEKAPVSWQDIDGTRVPVTTRYAVDADGLVHFVFPEGYNPNQPLVIDPELSYSTFLGSSGSEIGMAIVSGADGSAYVTGSTSSSDFPTVGPLQVYSAGEDVFLAKLNPAGDTLLFSTFLGGMGDDKGRGIALDTQERIALVGETESSNFPTVAAYDSTYAGGTCPSGPCDDVFVAALTSDGSALRYSTYLGSNQDEEGEEIAVDANGVLHLTGWTTSSGFPTGNGFDTTFGGGTCNGEPCSDGFLVSIDPSLNGTSSLRYGTFLGGNNMDKAVDLALDSAGEVHLTGYTRSSDYPVLTPWQTSRAGNRDAFLTKINTSLSGSASLRYSTFLGGADNDRGAGVAVDAEGRVYLTGLTRSDNFPLASPLQAARSGTTCDGAPCSDAFVSHLDLSSNTLRYSTYLGGSHEDEGLDIVVDGTGSASLIGYTRSSDFPVQAALQPTKGADSCATPPCADAMVTKVDSAGQLVYATFLGGSAEDYGVAISANGSGSVYLTGYTLSSDFPTTTGAYDLTFSGIKSDTFVAKISTATIPSPLQDATLELAPSAAGPNVTGTEQAFTLTLKDHAGLPLAAVTLQIVVTGPNTLTATATTDANGLASFTYSGAANGTDSVQATATDDAVQIVSNTATVQWVTPLETVTTSTIWGRFFQSDNTGVFNITPSTLPVFSQAFPSINFNPPSGTVPGNTSGVNEWTRPFTNVTMDLTSQYAGTIVAQGDGYQAGVGTLNAFNAVFTGQFTIAQAGDVTYDFYSDDGFIFGVGNRATRVSGVYTNPPTSGMTPFENYPVMGSVNVPTSPVRNSVTVNFPAPGVYPFEIDYSECCGWQQALTLAVRETGYGVTPTAALVISPNAQQSHSIGQQQTFTITALDASGAALGNMPVLLRVQGINSQEIFAVTDGTGQVAISYTGNYPGADTVQAVAWAQGSITAYSAEVEVNWSRPTNPPPLPPDVPLSVPGWLGSPANQSTLTGLVPISLASGITLASGTLDYWPADHPEVAKPLATNLSGSGTLATLDTTVLANGSYIIRLQGTSTSGQQVNSGILVTVNGEYKPGRVHFSITDFTVPLVGLPITIGRTYDSLEKETSGDFGYGWSLAIGNPKVEVDQANNVTITMPNGKRSTFYFKPYAPSPWFGFLLVPKYLPEAGVYGSLTADGCSLLTISGGSTFCFPGSTYQATSFTYTDPYGRQYDLGADGSLHSVTDLNGNVLTFSAEGLNGSVGNLGVQFIHDGEGRITQIIDPEGNTYNYGYDDQGDLATVTAPGMTTSLVYHYDSGHYFLGADDPRGNPLIVDTYYPDGRLESETDALGNVFHYAYDVNTRTTTVTNPDGGTIVSVYDANGKPLHQTDPLGQTTSYTYDANQNLLTQTDPLGHTTSYTYDGNGNQTSFKNALNQTYSTTYNQYGGPVTKTDALGNVQTIHYDARYLPTSITDELGTMASFTWDDHGSILTRADGNGKLTSNTYDAYGNLISETDPLNHTRAYTYDMLGRQTTATDALGQTTYMAYDALGHLTTLTEPLGKVTQFEYDANVNQTAVVDPLGKRTTYTYDAANHQTRVDYPDGSFETTTYDWRGNALTHTDAAGHTTRNQYDLAGQLTSLTVADGTADAGTTSFGYDTAGRKTSQTDPLGHTTSYTYDDAGRLLTITDALNHITTYAYDAAGRRTSTTDAHTHTTIYAYDARNRQTLTTYADGTTTTLTYDGNGQKLSRTDQSGKTTLYTYDDAGELLSVADPMGHLTAYGYDATGNLLTITDANGHVTTFGYDELGRQVEKIWPDLSYETFGYDLNDNQTSHRLTDGQTNAYLYDEMGRLTQVDYFNGQRVNYTYRADGLQQTVVDGRGTTNYAHDNQDRLIGITQPDGQVVSYSYDAAGNRLSMTTPAGTIYYSYDGAGQLASVTGASGAVSSYTYDAAGLRTQLVLPNGVTIDYSYDALDRLTGIDQHLGVTTLASYDYTLDPAGNRLSLTEVDGSSIQWTYDDAYRLASETRRDGSNAVTYQAGFTYDAVGNRLTQTVDGVATQYTYNELDQLLTAGVAQYRYDGRGNLAQVTNGTDVTQYAYDAADRLSSVTLPDGTAVAYTYDAVGRRVRQSVAAQVTYYLWDEISPYGDVVLETDGSGSTLASYVLGVTELLSQKRGGATSYYLHDGQGSTRTLTDDSGAVTDTYAYTAFGERYAQTGTTANAYQYTGQQFDSLTGLYSLRVRNYDSETGRFLTRDLASVFLDDPIELNRYLYVHNSPINFSDPSGRFSFADTAMIYTNVSVSPAAIVTLAALGTTVACVYEYQISVTMASNHNAAGLILLETMHPTPNICHIPILLYPGYLTPHVGDHMQDAQDAGYPMLLTYEASWRQRRINRSKACASVAPSCDEYPFASTEQSQYGTSARAVPWLENTIQGGYIGSFYVRAGIVGRQGAKFAVVVVPQHMGVRLAP
ncbi:MAG: DUF7948 domain-containing protein [Bellilinea sp.]